MNVKELFKDVEILQKYGIESTITLLNHLGIYIGHNYNHCKSNNIKSYKKLVKEYFIKEVANQLINNNLEKISNTLYKIHIECDLNIGKEYIISEDYLLELQF